MITLFDQLAAPFPVVQWRVGRTNQQYRKDGDPLKGQAFCYIDARDVMDRLDAVVGFDNWQNTYSAGVQTSIVCNIGIRITDAHGVDEWLWKSDGAGPSDMEADKGALSDAFKRAGVRWGIGRYLYDLKCPWFELEMRGKTPIIPKDVYPKLEKLHDDFARKLLPKKEQHEIA